LNCCKEKRNYSCFVFFFFFFFNNHETKQSYGVSPFEAPTPEAVFAKILSTVTIDFPEDPIVSDDAKHLICSLISPADKRLGANGGLADVQRHAWFKGDQHSNLMDEMQFV
jgi:hypothetical protein